MLRSVTSFWIAFSILTILLPCSGIAQDLEITPFRTANRSPLVQLYGIPSETSSDLQLAGHWEFSLTQDVASSYSVTSSANESILLDGELYRWSLNGVYGLTKNIELGVELPVELQTGGFLDGFIVDWHRFFGLPQGGRDSAASNQISYRYIRNGVTRLDVHRDAGGIGDMSFLAAYRLYSNREEQDHDTLALRAQLKLPTGNSSELLGSGSTDLSVFLTGAMNRQTDWGTVGVYASAGGMCGSDGTVLNDQRRNLVGFGTAGIGVAPADWIAFKVQGNFNTPLYKDSSLRELGKTAGLMTMGGTLRLPDGYILDIGVGEDIIVSTAPDVTFNLGLSKKF